MRMTFLSLAVAWVLLAGACSSVQMGGDSGGVDSSTLKLLSLKDLDGAPLKFADHVGTRVVVISFWATFCKPCKSEMPFLQAIHDTYGAEVLVVGISLDTPETEGQLHSFVKSNHYTYPMAIDRQSDAASLLNPKSVLPYLLVFDRQGNLSFQKDGFAVGDQADLENRIKGLIGP